MRVITDTRCLEHRPPAAFPEKPERLSTILDHLRGAGRGVEQAPRDDDACRRAVTAIHPPDYVERFERAVARGDSLFDSADNPIAAGTADGAWGAVAAVLAAADAAAAGEAAFAAVRPPGHHAEVATAMGFCYFNNAAVAAQHLLDRHGMEKVAIFDFDVHHGNGTQHIFEERADVLYVSTHQYPFYPGTGAAAERGRGPGEGFTVNAPLAAGTGDEGYRRAFDEVVLPALTDFAPDGLIVSAGFDAWRDDPLGGMRVSEAGYAEWGRLLGEWAAAECAGRVLVTLEGGYDIGAMPGLVEGHLAAMEGAL